MDETVKRELDKASKAAKHAELINALQAEFPDLKVSTDRWKNKRFCSKSVNNRADQVDFRFNCGCCSDSPCEARPYIETMGIEVFADPDRYWIGARCDWADNYPAVSEKPGWEEAMQKNGISQKAIDRTREYLDAMAPKFSEDDDDDPCLGGFQDPDPII
jgi:hypothetical protein